MVDLTVPIADERQREILKRAATDRVLRVNALAKELNVHEMTIRRDLDALAERGLLERTHGGARLAQQASAEVSYYLRVKENVKVKTQLANAALGLISDGDTVAIDPSTTCLALAKLLSDREVTVITNGLEVAKVLTGSDTPYILIGGSFHANSRAFVGSLTTPLLERLHADKVFLSVKGFTPRGGFTDVYLPEVEIKERMIASAGLVVVMMDHGKFGQEGLGTIVHADKVDVVITDREPDPVMREALESAGAHLVIAE